MKLRVPTFFGTPAVNVEAGTAVAVTSAHDEVYAAFVVARARDQGFAVRTGPIGLENPLLRTGRVRQTGRRLGCTPDEVRLVVKAVGIEPSMWWRRLQATTRIRALASLAAVHDTVLVVGTWGLDPCGIGAVHAHTAWLVAERPFCAVIVDSSEES